MLQIEQDTLSFTFEEVHPAAGLTVSFQRTLRIPDDGNNYPLPPGLGRFALRHVDDYAAQVPAEWVEHGGVMLPMYQSEALWISFGMGWPRRYGRYPFAVQVAAGKINAVTGKPWTNTLSTDPQNYMVAPNQPWLDGYCVEKGIIRQFVAMPLGSGYTAEEQITGHAEHGGLQIAVYPMKREVYDRRFPRDTSVREEAEIRYQTEPLPCAPAMGLAPGGRMRQEIYDDPYGLEDWDQEHAARCFVHIANSYTWKAITAEMPPHAPLSAKEYTQAGLPWFEYYDETAHALDGSETLKGLKSVAEMGKEKRQTPLPENDTLTPQNVIPLGKKKVHDGKW